MRRPIRKFIEGLDTYGWKIVLVLSAVLLLLVFTLYVELQE